MTRRNMAHKPIPRWFKFFFWFMVIVIVYLSGLTIGAMIARIVFETGMKVLYPQ